MKRQERRDYFHRQRGQYVRQQYGAGGQCVAGSDPCVVCRRDCAIRGVHPRIRGSKLALEDIVRGAKHHHVSVVVAEAEYPEGGEISPSRSNRDRFFVKHVVGSSFRRGQRFALSHLRHQWYTLVSSLPLYYRPVLYIS